MEPNLFEIINSNRSKFSCNTNTRNKKLIKFLNKNNIILPFILTEDFSENMKNILIFVKNYDFNFLKCQRSECTNETKYLGWIYNNRSKNSTMRFGFTTFCSDNCHNLWRAQKQLGGDNTCHRMTEETKANMKLINSIKMKKLISEGKFTPNITNSWAGSKCTLLINGNIKKYRSSWEAFFQIVNPNFEYEKIRISYKFEGIKHNYIVDFVDEHNKILYEIKPDSHYKRKLNQIKYKAAIKWCKQNQYKLIQIGNQWFKDNFNLYLTLLIGQPDQELILTRLKQFTNEN